tara:strand:+ start:642 stop:1058 length:417 start_codon:yes stop_codon:yes gene_type:complete
MAITQAMCTSFKQELFNKEHDLDTDTIKIALYTSSASLGAGTTAYSTANEISGAGYSAGGITMTGATLGTSGVVAFVDFNDPEWTSATFTTAGALIYNDDVSDKAIAVLSFGGDFTVTAGTFRIVLPAPGTSAILRID